jgi:hypothetical protein
VLASGWEGKDGSWSHCQSKSKAKDGCEERSCKIDDYKLTESTLRHLLTNKYNLPEYTKAGEQARHAKFNLVQALALQRHLA